MDFYQQTQINAAQRAADRAISRSDRQADDIADLKLHVERLSLACQAMWELLRDLAVITEDDIYNKILEIDYRDGQIDGKISSPPITCPSCNRTTSPLRDTCVMCGAYTKRTHVFEG